MDSHKKLKEYNKHTGLFFGLVFYAMGITLTMNDFGQVFFIGIGSLLITINYNK